MAVNQAVAVAFVAAGAGLLGLAGGGARWGLGVAGAVLMVLSSLLLIELDPPDRDGG